MVSLELLKVICASHLCVLAPSARLDRTRAAYLAPNPVAMVRMVRIAISTSSQNEKFAI